MSPRLLLALAPLLLSGCGALTRLSEIGRPPAMTPTADPTRDPGYRPLTMPMPAAQVAAPEANALWRGGSRAFFKDQRAAQVGDILTVVVKITDSADMKANTTAGRTGSETMGLPNLFGLEAALPRMITKAINPSQLVSASSANTNAGTSELARNSELRQLQVTGVIRPQDIASDNTVQHDRMAEARISYGGRGQLTDVQTPRWGQQVLDTLLPF